jgi:hypothetical protein
MIPRSSRAPEPFPDGSNRSLWLFVSLILVVFGLAILSLGGLTFPLHKDEYWFWRQTVFFVERWPPGLAELRSYTEPMTPLSFLVWATIERATGAGVMGGRLLNILLSVSILCMIGARRRDPQRRGLIAACGLLLFPYTIPLSIYLYTDIPAAFLVLLGTWLYARRHPVWSALAFALAIATRQYMVVFPLAIAAAEIAPAIAGQSDWKPRRTLPPLAAAASLGGWFFFFGSLGPPAGMEDWSRHVDAITNAVPAYGLYALSCLGAYFVVPEFLLYRRWRERGRLVSARSVALGALVAILFALAPPASQGVSMGALNRLTLAVLPPEVFGSAGVAIRNSLFALLAWLACLRFARLDLVGWLVLGHVALMVMSFEAWEKYDLTVLVVLWYLDSIFDPNQRIELWNAYPLRGGLEAFPSRATGSPLEDSGPD